MPTELYYTQGIRDFQVKETIYSEERMEIRLRRKLKLIYDNLDGFTRPLFVMAVWTGLREGDICTLKWSEVDLERHLITRGSRDCLLMEFLRGVQ